MDLTYFHLQNALSIRPSTLTEVALRVKSESENVQAGGYILLVIFGVKVVLMVPNFAVVALEEDAAVDVLENVDGVEADTCFARSVTGDVDMSLNVDVCDSDKVLAGYVCAEVAEGIISVVTEEYTVTVDIAVSFCGEVCETVVDLLNMLTVDAFIVVTSMLCVCFDEFEFDTVADNVDVINFVGVNVVTAGDCEDVVVFVICLLQ